MKRVGDPGDREVHSSKTSFKEARPTVPSVPHTLPLYQSILLGKHLIVSFLDQDKMVRSANAQATGLLWPHKLQRSLSSFEHFVRILTIFMNLKLISMEEER